MLQEIALGQIGLTSYQFWDMTPREFDNTISGWSKWSEVKEQLEWDRCRWQTSYLLQPHTKKGTKLRPTDLIKLPWDKKRIEQEKMENYPTKEDLLELLKNNPGF